MREGRELSLLYGRAVGSKLALFLARPSAALFYLRLGLRLLRLNDIDVTVVSYPKSGRTWLERLVIETVRGQLGLDRDFTGVPEMNAAGLDAPRFLFTHAGSSWEGIIRRDSRVVAGNLERHVQGKLILLVRDPRDVAVSAWHHLKYRSGMREMTPEDMLESPFVGLPKVLTFLNGWLRHVETRAGPSLLVRYEDLHRETLATWRRIAEFAGLPTGDRVLAAAVDRCSFRRMSAREREGGFASPRLQATGPEGEKSQKVRSGRIGQFDTLFTSGQVARMNERIRSVLRPEYGYSSPPEEARE